MDRRLAMQRHFNSIARPVNVMECYIIKPAKSLLMKHLVIGQR